MSAGRFETIPYLEDETQDALAARVFVPGQYSPLYKYGILYVFDGLDYLSKGRMQQLIEAEFGEQLPFLIAFLPVSAELRAAAYDPQGARHERHLHAVARGLVRKLESEYTLIPLGSARGLLGSSLGAAMAFALSVAYPKRFRYLALQSPYWPSGQDHVVHGLTKTTLMGCEADLFVGAAEHTGTLKNGHPHDYIQDAKSYQATLLQGGGHARLHLRPGGHTWDAWKGDLPQILHQFAGQVKQFDGDAASHP